MADRLIISLDAEGALLDWIGRAVRKLRAPRDLFETIGAVLEGNIQERFDAKVDPAGQPWAPLAESTKERYAKKYKGVVPGSLLDRSRQMRNSLAANATDTAVEVGLSRLTPDGKWNVAALHELGTEHMPRRGLLTADPKAGTLGDEDRRDVMTAVQRFLDGL